MDAPFAGRILVLEDDEFTRSLISDGLSRVGIEVRAASGVSEALQMLIEFDPHVVVSDLNLGPGPSGAALLSRVAEDFPWIGLIALTAHSSPELAVSDGRSLPESAVYVVKSSLRSMADLLPLASAAIAKVQVDVPQAESGKWVLSASQGEVLLLLAEGYSNAGIALSRGISTRAAESHVARIFSSLGIEADPLINPRVTAVRLWQQGKVVVR